MTTEFPGRFMRLFAGPMWSGQSVENRQNPQKVRITLYGLVNIFVLLVTLFYFKEDYDLLCSYCSCLLTWINCTSYNVVV